jgi:hypothetical protein
VYAVSLSLYVVTTLYLYTTICGARAKRESLPGEIKRNFTLVYDRFPSLPLLLLPVFVK